MSMKLSAHLRQRIAATVMRDTLGKREKALSKEETRLALAVLKRHCGKSFSMLAEAPEGFFEKQGSISLNVAGRHTQLHYGSAQRAPFSADSWKRVLNLGVDDELGAKIIALQDAQKDLAAQKERVAAQSMAVLGSVSTVERLLEVWPTVKKFIPAEALEERARTLPAVLVANLNATIQALKVAA